MARPFRVELHREAFAFGRHLDFLPPQWPFGGLHQQVAFTGGRRRNGDVGGIAVAIRRFIQRQLDLVGAHGAAFGVVLGLVTGPEAQAADQAGLRVFDLDAVRPPLHLEADLGGVAGLDVQALFVEVEEFLVVVVAPAVVVRVVPVVVAALAHQAHLKVLRGEFLPVRVGQQHFEFRRAIAIGFGAVKQPTQARHLLRRPDRLHQASGNRASARLLQAGLHDQLQRRLGLGPFAFQDDFSWPLASSTPSSSSKSWLSSSSVTEPN